jgi:hypothetical protein
MSNLVNKWYPKKLTAQQVRRKIIREAYMEGFNPKEIAGYFRVSLGTIYANLNVKSIVIKQDKT